MPFIPSLLTISIIHNPIDYSTVTYCDLNTLDIEMYRDITIDVRNRDENHILIDISSFVNSCIQIGKSTFNLMLGALSNNFGLYFNKNDINDIPKLVVTDENSCDSDDQQAAIALSLRQASENTVIPPNEVIRFDTIDTKTPYGIEYDVEKGEIRLLRTGFYLFHWHFNVEGSTYISLENIGLRDNSTGLVYPYPVPTSIQGQISGMALAQVSNANTSYSLINLSEGDILLTNTNPCATIIVHRV